MFAPRHILKFLVCFKILGEILFIRNISISPYVKLGLINPQIIQSSNTPPLESKGDKNI